MEYSGLVQAGLRASLRRASSLNKEHQEVIENYVLYEEEVAVLITGIINCCLFSCSYQLPFQTPRFESFIQRPTHKFFF